jgi:hypothetical protein
MGLLRFGKGQPEIARLRGASIERIGGGDDAPSGGIRALYLDRQNGSGLARIKTASCGSIIPKPIVPLSGDTQRPMAFRAMSFFR